MLYIFEVKYHFREEDADPLCLQLLPGEPYGAFISPSVRCRDTANALFSFCKDGKKLCLTHQMRGLCLTDSWIDYYITTQKKCSISLCNKHTQQSRPRIYDSVWVCYMSVLWKHWNMPYMWHPCLLLMCIKHVMYIYVLFMHVYIYFNNSFCIYSLFLLLLLYLFISIIFHVLFSFYKYMHLFLNLFLFFFSFIHLQLSP